MMKSNDLTDSLGFDSHDCNDHLSYMLTTRLKEGSLISHRTPHTVIRPRMLETSNIAFVFIMEYGWKQIGNETASKKIYACNELLDALGIIYRLWVWFLSRLSIDT